MTWFQEEQRKLILPDFQRSTLALPNLHQAKLGSADEFAQLKSIQEVTQMLLLVILLLLLFGGGGGYYGYSSGYYGGGGFSIVGILVLVLVVMMVFGRGSFGL
jgi:hypothetical protein